jgi:hypothetical protein
MTFCVQVRKFASKRWLFRMWDGRATRYRIRAEVYPKLRAAEKVAEDVLILSGGEKQARARIYSR